MRRVEREQRELIVERYGAKATVAPYADDWEHDVDYECFYGTAAKVYPEPYSRAALHNPAVVIRSTLSHTGKIDHQWAGYEFLIENQISAAAKSSVLGPDLGKHQNWVIPARQTQLH